MTNNCVPCCEPCSPRPGEDRTCKSRELRMGILYTTCECVKRNGLQFDCPRSGCRGASCCRTQPNPSCCNSQFPRRFSNMTMGMYKRRTKGKSCDRGACEGCNPPSFVGGGSGGVDGGCCTGNVQIPLEACKNCGYCRDFAAGGATDRNVWK